MRAIKKVSTRLYRRFPSCPARTGSDSIAKVGAKGPFLISILAMMEVNIRARARPRQGSSGQPAAEDCAAAFEFEQFNEGMEAGRRPLAIHDHERFAGANLLEFGA
jgi:hypothetical protein